MAPNGNGTTTADFTRASTDPISRSASGISADATKARVSELLERLDDAMNEAKQEVQSDPDLLLPADSTFKQAKSFAMSLHPFSLPLVMCLNDGGICFQWNEEQGGILTATLYGDNALVFVARFGPKDRATGTTTLRNDTIPESVLVWLKTYFMPSSKQPWMNTSATVSH